MSRIPLNGWSPGVRAPSATILPERCSEGTCVVHIEGPLRFPITRALRHEVRVLLRQGERRLVLDMKGVSRIDAAGVGELVRAYNMGSAVNGVVRIENASARVRKVLELVGLFSLLTRGGDPDL